VTLSLLICLALIALLAYREWGSARDRKADRLYREALQRELIEQRQVAATERQELYQRIQAPEIAVAEAHRERRGPYVPRKPIGADNDKAFMERGERSNGA
jgi:hypothetical protein